MIKTIGMFGVWLFVSSSAVAQVFYPSDVERFKAMQPAYAGTTPQGISGVAVPMFPQQPPVQVQMPQQMTMPAVNQAAASAFPANQSVMPQVNPTYRYPSNYAYPMVTAPNIMPSTSLWNASVPRQPMVQYPYQAQAMANRPMFQPYAQQPMMMNRPMMPNNMNPFQQPRKPAVPAKPPKKRVKAWGEDRHIWPDFYTDFTDDAWDFMMKSPRDMGYMPGGWRFPYISMPDPVTVGDAVANQMPPIMEEVPNFAPVPPIPSMN